MKKMSAQDTKEPKQVEQSSLQSGDSNQQPQPPPQGFYSQTLALPALPPMMITPSGVMVAPPMMLKPPALALYPGQGGMNPCYWCKFCCAGTCSLKTGCIVIAFYLLLNAFVALIFVPDARTKFKDNDTAFVRDLRRIINHVYEADWRMGLFLVDGLLINLKSSTLLFAGCVCLNQLCCFSFAVFQALSCIWILIFTGLLTARVSAYKGQMEDKEHDVMTVVIALLWIGAVFAMLLRIYFLFCGFALGLQIGRGEYGPVGGRRTPLIVSGDQSQIYNPDNADASQSLTTSGTGIS